MAAVKRIEAWGRGMPLILEKAPTVKFEDVAGIFVARFARLPQASQGTPSQSSGKTPLKTLGKTPGKIMELLSSSPALSIPEIALKLAKSESAIERAIRKLRESNRLRRIGPDKGGHWEVLT